MPFIDSHTHLFLEQFDEDRAEVVKRAQDAGVEQLLLPNIDASTLDRMWKMVEGYPETCSPMVGLHPGSVNESWKEELEKLRPHLKDPRVVAVGEVGMDLYWDTTYLHQQRLVFREMIAWAKETGLPLVIHARDAFEELFNILDEEISDELKGVFHCFTGTVEQGQKIMSYPNFYLGIGGVATYKKAAMHEVLDKLPIDRMILETDAPYLSPVPFRGKRNESAYLLHTAEKLADIHSCTLAEVERITTENCKKLFQLS